MKERKKQKCAYLCAVHLNECARKSGHHGDCYCSEHGTTARCVMLRAVQVAKMDNPEQSQKFREN